MSEWADRSRIILHLRYISDFYSPQWQVPPIIKTIPNRTVPNRDSFCYVRSVVRSLGWSVGYCDDVDLWWCKYLGEISLKKKWNWTRNCVHCILQCISFAKRQHMRMRYVYKCAVLKLKNIRTTRVMLKEWCTKSKRKVDTDIGKNTTISMQAMKL